MIKHFYFGIKMDYIILSKLIRKEKWDEILSLTSQEMSDNLKFLIMYALVQRGSASSIELIFNLTNSGYFDPRDERFIRSGLYDIENLWSTNSIYSPEAILEACYLNNFILVRNYILQIPTPNQKERNKWTIECEKNIQEILSTVKINVSFDNDMDLFDTLSSDIEKNTTVFNKIQDEKNKLVKKIVPSLSLSLRQKMYIEACKGGCLDIIKFLNLDPNFLFDSMSPLMYAVQHGRIKVVEYLENQSDFYQIGKDGQNCLHVACSTSDNVKVVNKLLDIDKIFKVSNQKLVVDTNVYSVKNGTYEIESLINHLNQIQDEVVFTFEDKVIVKCDRSCMLLFNQTYSNVLLGQMLGLCSSGGKNIHVDMIHEAEYYPGVLQNQLDRFGMIPLHRAVIAYHIEIIKVLSEISNKSQADFNGITPIEYAYQKDDRELLRFLE